MNHEINSIQIKNIHDEQTHLMLYLSFDLFITYISCNLIVYCYSELHILT